MEDDKEKAEKLAAARKRFEQLKKKGKKGGAAAGGAKEEPTEEKAGESSQAEAAVTSEPAPPSPKPDQSALVAELQEQLASLRTENESLNETISQLRSKEDELGVVIVEKDELKEQLDATQAELQDVKKELAEAKAATRQTTEPAQPVEDIAKVDVLTKDLEALSKELEAARAREASVSAELTTARTRISSLQAELAGLKATQDLFPGASPPPAITPRAVDVRNLDDEQEVSQLEEAERQRLRDRVKGLEARLSRDEAVRESLELKRKERRKEVERGLEKWKGWKIDLIAAGGGRGVGPVFDV